MNPLVYDDTIARLGMALLHFVWQGALVGCLAALGLALMRNARPQARYALCGAALLMCLLLPLCHLLVNVPAHPGAATPMAALRLPADQSLTNLQAGFGAMSATAVGSGLPMVVLAWALGVALMASRLTAGLVEVRRLCAAARAATHPVDPAWVARLATLARRMGLREVPQLHILDGLQGPVTVTTSRWRPLVLVPASLLTHLPVELIEALLAHELAHVRRFDHVANLVQSVVEVLLFYHPVVWWLSQRLRTEREQIADDLAAQAIGQPRQLAVALSELAGWQVAQRTRTSDLVLSAHGGRLMTRITRLVQPTIQRPLGAKLVLPVAGLVALAIAAQAASLPQVAESTTQPPEPTPAATVPSTKATAHHSINLGDEWQPFAYALVAGREGSTTLSGNDRDWRDVKAKRATIQGEFLWVRQGKQRYIVTDAAALAEVKSLWAPVSALDAQIEQLDQQMETQAEVLERTASQIVSLHEAPSAELHALGQQMSKLQEQRDMAQIDIDKLSGRMAATRDQKQLEQLERQQERMEQALEPLDASIDALSEQMERIEGDQERAMDESLEQQERDTEQAMERLERQMEGLSERQEAAVRAAEQRLRGLVQEFVKRGLAVKA
jgi:beta-lactamase regulating signal transducer with metallopeptidase domain/predicted  nucleic acid-binding Zn-ribbon protein